jgi:polar amino acid transport system substrate-binding protein
MQQNLLSRRYEEAPLLVLCALRVSAVFQSIRNADPATNQKESSKRRSTINALNLVVAILALAFSTLSCAPKAKSTLVVGMELNYPPFEMVNPQGQPAGISVEIANELGKFLRKEIQIQNIPFDGLIPALKTGKIDLIISSMTETPERAKSIDFSEPYLRTGLCLLINKDAGIDSIEQADRANFSIAVKQGTTGQLYARQYLRNARILVLDKEDACVLEVIQNKAQAFIYDQMSIFKHWQQHQDSTKAVLKPFQEEQWAIGIRGGQQTLKSQVNAFLAAFKKNGGFDKLGDEYLKEQKEQFRKLGIPFYF